MHCKGRRRRQGNALVENVELLGRRVLLEQLRRHLALGSQDDAILGQDSNGGSGMGDGLQGVLDLVETAFWREDGCLGRRSAMARQRRLSVLAARSWGWVQDQAEIQLVRRLTRESYLRDMVGVSRTNQSQILENTKRGLIACRVWEEGCWWDGMGWLA